MNIIRTSYFENKKPNKWLDQIKRHAAIIRRKTVIGRIIGRFSNFDKCRPEVAGDVILNAAVDKVGMNIRVKFGDCRLNSGRII